MTQFELSGPVFYVFIANGRQTHHCLPATKIICPILVYLHEERDSSLNDVDKYLTTEPSWLIHPQIPYTSDADLPFRSSN